MNGTGGTDSIDGTQGGMNGTTGTDSIDGTHGGMNGTTGIGGSTEDTDGVVEILCQRWIGKDFYNPFIKDFIELDKPFDGQ